MARCSPGTGRPSASCRCAARPIARAYYGVDRADDFVGDGWFRTGDIVTIDEHGSILIADRARDVVKSGGEWISSVALENALMAHPEVVEAAVFAAEDERWGERPLAAVVHTPGASVGAEELRAFIEPHFLRWWLPAEFIACRRAAEDLDRQVRQGRAPRALRPAADRGRRVADDPSAPSPGETLANSHKPDPAPLPGGEGGGEGEDSRAPSKAPMVQRNSGGGPSLTLGRPLRHSRKPDPAPSPWGRGRG